MSIESVLKMDRLFFEEIDLQRKIINPTQEEYKYNFTRNISAVDNNHFVVSLQCNIRSTDEEESLKLSVKATGWFECMSDNEEEKKILIQQNAIAIMFPYLRSQIILVTTQPDILPIQLPIINITALFNDENIED
ncbi:MAG: protein-export chaperone SecB [Ruminococcus sp.]